MPTFAEQRVASVPERPTRTQRVQYQYEQQQENERIKKAVEMQQKDFINVKSIEEYQQRYAEVPAELKPYFATPQEIQQSQQTKIATEQTAYQKAIEDAQAKLDRAKAELKDYEEYARTSNSRKENLRAGREKREADIDYAEIYLRELQRNAGKVQEGYSTSDIQNFAEQKVDYEQRKDQLQYQERKEAEKQLKDYEQNKMPSNFNAIVKQYFVDYTTGKETLLSEKLYKSGELVGEIFFPDKSIGMYARAWSSADKDANKSYYIGEPATFTTPKEVIVATPTGFTVTQQESKLAKLDTTLVLSSEPEKTTLPTIITTSGDISNIEKYDVMFYKGIISKGFDVVKGAYEYVTGKKEDTGKKYVPIEYETKTEASRTGEKGTVITTYGFSEKTSAYYNNLIKANLETEKIANISISQYEAKIKALPEDKQTQEQIDKIKKEVNQDFRAATLGISTEANKKYMSEIKEIERSKKWAVQDMFPLSPIGLLRKGYYKSQDVEQRKMEREQVKPSPYSIKALGLTEDELLEKKYKWYKEFREDAGYSPTLAKEMADIKYNIASTYTGGYETIRTQPLTIGYKAGLWAGGTAVITIASTYTGGLGGIATSKALASIGKVTLGIYAGSILVRSALEPTTYQRGYKLGQIGASEVLPMTIGTIAGQKIAKLGIRGIEEARIKFGDYQYVSPYKVTEMELLRGKKEFLTAPQRLHMKKFLEQQYALPDEKEQLKGLKRLQRGKSLPSGYHATTVRFKEGFTVNVGDSELEGMYVAHGGSLHFALGGKSSYSLSSKQFLPTGSTPTLLRIKSAEFKTIPKGYKTSLSTTELKELLRERFGTDFIIKKGWKNQVAYLLEHGKEGYFYIPRGKAEVEAVAVAGTRARQQIELQKYFTRVTKPEFYESLEGFSRKGYQEYVNRVAKFSITKPSTWIDKIIGRQAGTFKSTKVGIPIPIERYELLTTSKKLIYAQEGLLGITPDGTEKRILGKEAVEKKMLEDYKVSGIPSNKRNVNLIKQIIKGEEFPTVKELLQKQMASSYLSQEYYAFTPSSSVAGLSYLYPKPSSYKVPSSYSLTKSYSYSTPPSVKSVISSAIGSSVSSGSIPSYPSVPSYPSIPSYPSVPSYPSYVPPSSISYYISGKSKKKKKVKFIPKEALGLFPDFTARAVGLEAPEYDVKQAVKEIAKIQTGFEIRRGGKIKGYDAEKSVLKEALRRM